VKLLTGLPPNGRLLASPVNTKVYFSGKHSSLLLYVRRKSYFTGANVIKLFLIRDLWIFVLSQSVC
jgi:hypothetical protein